MEATKRGPLLRTGGQNISASGQLKVTKTTQTVVETASSWSAGALSGSLHSHYEPDGCMRVELALHPTPTPVQGLTLRIPLRLDEAPLMHAVTDLLRMHCRIVILSRFACCPSR